MEIACLKEAKRNLHAKLSGIVEPFPQKVPPTLLLPAPVVTPTPSPDQIIWLLLRLLLKLEITMDSRRLWFLRNSFWRLWSIWQLRILKIKGDSSIGIRRLQRLNGCFERSYKYYHPLINPSFKTLYYLCFLFHLCTGLAFLMKWNSILGLLFLLFYLFEWWQMGSKNDCDFDISNSILKPKHVFICYDIGDYENFKKNVLLVNQVF